MNWIAETLWDLIEPTFVEEAVVAPTPVRRGPAPPAAAAMQDRYDELVRDMKQRFSVRIRKWRSGMSGCAWSVFDANGNTTALIESPYPRGPMSCAVFLHEIGHHAIGFDTYAPVCLEEYHAWRWSLEMMAQRGLNITDAVLRRRDESVQYAVEKAIRRGLKLIPEELERYRVCSSTGFPADDTGE